MKQAEPKADTSWRKSRLGARLLLRKETRPLRPREQMLARRLSRDAEVTNRLIQQALYFLGIGSRKHDFDQKLFKSAISNLRIGCTFDLRGSLA